MFSKCFIMSFWLFKPCIFMGFDLLHFRLCRSVDSFGRDYGGNILTFLRP